MRALKYTDRATCDYVTGHVSGFAVLVVAQRPGASPSITNRIAEIVTLLLAKDLYGIDAPNLRVFEFYSPSMNPTVVWQQVKFAKVERFRPKKTTWQRMHGWLSSIFKTPPAQRYIVAGPRWGTISPELAAQLATLDAALV